MVVSTANNEAGLPVLGWRMVLFSRRAAIFVAVRLSSPVITAGCRIAGGSIITLNIADRRDSGCSVA